MSADIRSILVPLDGSALSHQAIVPAGDIARRVGRALAIAVVHPWGPAEEAPFAGTEADLRLRDEEIRYLELVERRVMDTFRVPTSGKPGSTIASLAARWKVNLVAITTRRRSEGERLLLGSVADTVVQLATVPVLVCHAAEVEHATELPQRGREYGVMAP